MQTSSTFDPARLRVLPLPYVELSTPLPAVTFATLATFGSWISKVECEDTLPPSLATRDEVRELLDSLVRSDIHIVADFSSAQFVDASILRVLLDTSECARELGKVFRLQLGTAAIVRRAFEICGVFEVVEHVATRGEALARRER
jgi:anti-anti-sigma regulatory factor